MELSPSIPCQIPRKSDPDDVRTSNDSDITLILAFRNGEQRAFDELVIKYQNMVLNLCVRIVGNRAEGEDAAQETFFRAFRHLNTFRGESLFSTWLYRIAINICRNQMRSFWRGLTRNTLKLDKPAPDDEHHRNRELSDTSLSPENDLERHRIREAVMYALEKLPVKHKEVIVLRDIQGHDYEEIGGILGISLGTVKSRLARARSAMQEMLRGHIDGLY